MKPFKQFRICTLTKLQNDTKCEFFLSGFGFWIQMENWSALNRIHLIWNWSIKFNDSKNFKIVWIKVDILKWSLHTIDIVFHIWSPGFKQTNQWSCFWAIAPFKWVSFHIPFSTSMHAMFVINELFYLVPFTQINFNKTHKKVLISPEKRSITFVSDFICPANFKTVSFDFLAAHQFSTHDFAMFKYVTALLLSLIESLLPVDSDSP